jgi:hypothetical protein
MPIAALAAMLAGGGTVAAAPSAPAGKPSADPTSLPTDFASLVGAVEQGKQLLEFSCATSHHWASNLRAVPNP